MGIVALGRPRKEKFLNVAAFVKNTTFSITKKIFKILQKHVGTSPPELVKYIRQVENIVFFPELISPYAQRALNT